MATRVLAFSNRTTSVVSGPLFEGYSDELLTFAAVTCILFMVVGVPGNLLTIVALSRGRQHRNSTAVFIINLSLSDLLFGCFNLPLAASTFLRRSWVHGDLLCRLFPLLRYGLLAVSLFTISLITINRYVIIAHPRQYPRIYQHRYLALMVAGSWILAFSFMVPTWRGIWGRFGLDTEIGSCSILHDQNNRSPKECLFVLGFLVPCCCIVFCYARIFHLVRQAASRTRANVPTPSAKEQEPQTQDQTQNQNPNQTALVSTGDLVGSPFAINEDIEYIDGDHHPPRLSISSAECKDRSPFESSDVTQKSDPNDVLKAPSATNALPQEPSSAHGQRNAVKTSLKTSLKAFSSRKSLYVSFGNTSNASTIYPGRMSQKDKRLLNIILVIFVLFLVCYLPITLTKIWKSITAIHAFNISGYLLIYLTTCTNPIIYVLMSSEYRQAYWNLLRCKQDAKKPRDSTRLPRS